MPENEQSQLLRASMDGIIKSPGIGAFIVRRSDYAAAYSDIPGVFWGGALTGGYTVGYTDRANLDTFLKDEKVFSRSAPLSLMSQIELDSINVAPITQNPYLNLKGGGVLIGLADTGIDYAKPAFRWEDGTTKIKCIWDQGLPGGAMAPFGYGAEFTQGLIDEALAAGGPYETVNHQDMNGHGTFLACAAAGRMDGGIEGVAPDAELIAVKLKDASEYCRGLYMVPPQNENIYETVDLMNAIEYMIGKAAEMGRPIVICIGLGTNYSSHDGSSVLEEYLSGLSDAERVAVCCAAGNEGAG